MQYLFLTNESAGEIIEVMLASILITQLLHLSYVFRLSIRKRKRQREEVRR